MKQWTVIYEYCNDPSCAEASAYAESATVDRSEGRHPNCANDEHQRTILIQTSPAVPELNLLASKLIEEIAVKEEILAKTVAHITDTSEFLPRRQAGETRDSRLVNLNSKFVHKLGTHVSSVAHKTITFRMPIPIPQFVGFMLLALGLGGMLAPYTQNIRLESTYVTEEIQTSVKSWINPPKVLPKSVPVVFEPLMTPDGASIDPINKDFSLIIPKIGVNANIVADVDPASPAKYADALEHGVAHAATSFYPDQNGTVYLFSHSTNFDWFVKDLNAIFYLVKNLDTGDSIVLFYKGHEYTYKVTGKKIVSPTDTSYLIPVIGKRNLILQTCWPPGSTTERLLIFANLLSDNGVQI